MRTGVSETASFHLRDCLTRCITSRMSPKSPAESPAPLPSVEQPLHAAVHLAAHQEKKPRLLSEAMQTAAEKKVSAELRPISDKLTRLRATLDAYEVRVREDVERRSPNAILAVLDMEQAEGDDTFQMASKDLRDAIGPVAEMVGLPFLESRGRASRPWMRTAPRSLQHHRRTKLRRHRPWPPPSSRHRSRRPSPEKLETTEPAVDARPRHRCSRRSLSRPRLAAPRRSLVPLR